MRLRSLLYAAPVATALIFAGVTPALAGSAPPSPKLATLACQISSPGCNEPVVAVAQTSADDFTQAKDAALSVVGSQVWTRPNNALDNGTQDWLFVQVGTVPLPGGGGGGYKFTAFDRANYGGDPIFVEEWFPFGQDSGQCLRMSPTSNQASLAACDPLGRNQAFIVDRTIPFINPPASPSYTFGLSVRQATTIQRHLCLTASDTGLGRVSRARCINHSPGNATNQMWSALP